MDDLTTLPEPLLARVDQRPSSITATEQRRIAEWIRDAFAILCARTSGRSVLEARLRLGFESILRQLGTSPLRELSDAHLPAYVRANVSTGDLRTIIRALDSCLAVFARYDALLTTKQRHLQILVRATRRIAADTLEARASSTSGPAMAGETPPLTARIETLPAGEKQ